MTDLQKTISSYFKNREEVVAIYIYGSHASGKERRFSDVDVGIILHHPVLRQAFKLQSEYMIDLGRQLRKDVHTVILNTAGELLLKQVFSKGYVICVNDQNAFRRFRMNRYSMISEFGYYLKMTQSGFRHKLMEEGLHG